MRQEVLDYFAPVLLAGNSLDAAVISPEVAGRTRRGRLLLFSLLRTRQRLLTRKSFRGCSRCTNACRKHEPAEPPLPALSAHLKPEPHRHPRSRHAR
jgi:hypothetical protein